MNDDALRAALQALPRPEAAEEWVISAEPDAAALPSEEYRRAIRDLLTALGILAPQSGDYTSPSAFYFVQSLLAAMQDDALSGENWQAGPLGACDGFGARLLHMLEAHRLDCVPAPTPLRNVEAVMGVIKARRDGQDMYLMQYDKGAAQFQPLGGKREAYDATLAHALAREICEELELDEVNLGEHCQITPLIEHIKINTISASLHIMTQYDHSFYLVSGIQFPIQTDKITRWLTADELRGGQTADGYAVSMLLREHLADRLDTLPYSL